MVRRRINTANGRDLRMRKPGSSEMMELYETAM
jgi:hypothetical protein